MDRLRLPTPAAGVLSVALAFGAPAAGQAAHDHAASAPSSANLQGNDQAAWIKDPHWRQYYELTIAAFAGGPAKVDVAAYEQKS